MNNFDDDNLNNKKNNKNNKIKITTNSDKNINSPKDNKLNNKFNNKLINRNASPLKINISELEPISPNKTFTSKIIENKKQISPTTPEQQHTYFPDKSKFNEKSPLKKYYKIFSEKTLKSNLKIKTPTNSKNTLNLNNTYLNSPTFINKINDKIETNYKKSENRLNDKINIMTYSHNYKLLSEDIEKVIIRLENMENIIETELKIKNSLLKLYDNLNEKISKFEFKDLSNCISKCQEIIKLNNTVLEKCNDKSNDESIIKLQQEIENKNKKIEELYIRIKILESKTILNQDLKNEVLEYLDDYDIILKRKEAKINELTLRIEKLENK